MTLSSGTRLGPYEILSPIGAGGMGEVYRARDSRLKRDVAIKVLPESLENDAEALARLEREARAIAALSHPNILAIHDFGSQDGVSYVVTELLTGTTLRERLVAEPIAQRQAVDIALQIAKGLAAAHTKGIVHRDLKPANLFVMQDGHVKILDFGLAKQMGHVPADEDSNLATEAQHTEPGRVMGTIGYMSPEQVRGVQLDHRSDIFSFGAILYEMLSGKKAFKRNSDAETMTAILREEPPELSESGRTIAPALDRIVKHCLNKSAEQRFQSAHDLAFALESVSASSSSGLQAAVSVPATISRRRMLIPVIFGSLAAVLAAATFLTETRWRNSEPPVFHRITFQRGLVHAARFSSDGRTIVYSAEWNGGAPEIYSSRVESTESRPLAMGNAALLALSTADEIAIAKNPESAAAEVYWTVLSGTLGTAPLAGGATHDILEGVEFADFAPDGHSLAVVRTRQGKRSLEYPIGKVLYTTVGWIGEPRVSPAGDSVAFLDHPTNGAPDGVLSVVDRRGKKTTLASGFLRAQGLAWTPNGKEIWVTATRTGSARVLYAESLSGKERLITRVPGALTIHDISRDGRVLLAHEDIRRGIEGRAVGATAERDLTWLDLSVLSGISADGSAIAIAEFGEGGGPGRKTYIRKMDGSPASLVAAGYASYDLSRDGRWVVAFADLLSAQPRIVLLPAGLGQMKTLQTVPMNYQNAAFSPDGRKVFFSAIQPGHALRTYVQDISGGPPQPITPEGTAWRYPELFLAVSPEAGTIVVRDAEGKALLWPVGGGKPREIPGFDSRTEMGVQLGADGRSLYVASIRGGPNRLCRLDIETGKREACIELKPSDAVGLVAIDFICVTPDRRAYAYSFVRRTCDLYIVEGLK